MPIDAAILGLVGGVAEGVLGFFDKKGERKHELAVMEKSMEATRIESEALIARERVEQEGRAAEADSRNLLASMEMDRATYSSGVKIPDLRGWLGLLAAFLLVLVDFFRGSFRPGATWTALIASVYLYVTTGSIPPDLAALTELMVAWWFGSRGSKKILKGAHEG